MLEWIFFDATCTLIDEDEAVLARVQQVIRAERERGRVWQPEQILSKMRLALQRGESAFHGALRALDIPGQYPFPHHLERAYPWVVPLLGTLRARGVHLGILANQPCGWGQRLTEFGLDGFFEQVVLSDEVGLSKPSPALFRYALTRAGVPAQRAVMVGDSPEKDIAPAAALGFTTVWIRQGMAAALPPPPTVHPDYVAEDGQQLGDVLLSLFPGGEGV